MIVLSSENKNTSNFILNEIVKKKILDMYNISKNNPPSEATQKNLKTPKIVAEK